MGSMTTQVQRLVPIVELRSLRRIMVVAAAAAAYFVAGRLGLLLLFVNASAIAVWLPTGIAIAAFLTLGYRIWPAILCSALLVSLTTGGSVTTSLGIAVGNTLEGLLTAYLVNRFANGRGAFGRPRDTFRFALLALLGTTVSPIVGITTLSAAGFAEWIDFGRLSFTWWLGDAVGAIVVTPVLLLWGVPSGIRWTRARALEGIALLAALLVVGAAVFGGLWSTGRHHSLDFLCLPILVWAAFRFAQREVALALATLVMIAIVGTLHGYGPFAREAPPASLVLLQAFVGVTSVVSLALAAVVSRRQRFEAELRYLADNDPLTELANIRQAMHVLDGEIRRSQRTGRPLAVLFLDLDRLKRINDHHGHLAGNRALCRLADALRASSRAIDTAARLGGDEFVLILPETGEARAWQVATRLAQSVAADAQRPALSVSVGVAVYPRDGDSVEGLLGVADRVLYDAKARS